LAHCCIQARRVALPLLLLLTVSAGAAQGEHGAHRHGHGTLDVAVDGNDWVMVLKVPALNVVGFEHQATLPAEHALVEDAVRRFLVAGDLFQAPKRAGCRLERADVDLAGKKGSAVTKSQRKPDISRTDHKNEHAHSDADSDKHSAEHSELLAEYSFHCAAPQHLTRLETRLFTALRNAERIDVQIVTPSFQGATTLLPRTRTIKLQ
jgi:hypothetical protein